MTVTNHVMNKMEDSSAQSGSRSMRNGGVDLLEGE
jgi:hypothetical protein